MPDRRAPATATGETGRRHRSFRLAPSVARDLERRSAELGTSQAALVERYIDEGVRTDEHPAISFVDGPAGRRPRLSGSGLDVWEIVETFRANENSIAETAAYLGLHARLVRDALRYYADYRTEIDAWIDRVREASEREEAAVKRFNSVIG